MKIMKKIILILIVILLALQICGQNEIVNSNSAWSILQYGLTIEGNGDGMPQQTICCVGTEVVTIEHDSVFNEKEYKKVFSKNGEKQELKGLIREEGKKVYFITQNSSTEHLLYDFSIENDGMITIADRSGSDITLYAVIDEILINEVKRKRIRLKFSLEYEEVVNTWIEGIGSTCGLLYNGLPKTGGGMKLLCVSQEGTLVYQNPLFPKCSYDDGDRQEIGSILGLPVHTGLSVINDAEFSAKVSNEKVTIHSSGRKITQIEVFNVSGQKIYSEKQLTNPHEIQLKFLNKGLNIIKLHDADNRSHHLKFIKK